MAFVTSLRSAGAGMLQLMLVLGCMLAGCSSKPAQGRTERPPPLVSVVTLEKRDVDVEIHAPVDLRPLFQADVGSKTLGYLDAVLVDRGDKVKRGQVIAIIRPSDLPDQLAASKGVVAQMEASLNLARTNHDRIAHLAPSGVVSQQELQQAEASLATATAAQAAAKAQLSALAVRLGEMRIESPLDGYVVQRKLDPGALVGPLGSGAIVTVVRTDVLRVFITVNERDSAMVAVGKEARVMLDALPGRVFRGSVVRLAPFFDSTTRTLDAEVQLTNLDGALRPGMYGRGSIVLDHHPGATVLPAAALQISDLKRYVFVLDGNRVRRKDIETGYDDGEWLEVKSGVKAGEEVIIAGADGLSEGSVVRVFRATPSVAPEADAASPAASSPTAAPAPTALPNPQR
jgi:membrane fusion protein (multidrug efflux system)